MFTKVPQHPNQLCSPSSGAQFVSALSLARHRMTDPDLRPSCTHAQFLTTATAPSWYSGTNLARCVALAIIAVGAEWTEKSLLQFQVRPCDRECDIRPFSAIARHNHDRRHSCLNSLKKRAPLKMGFSQGICGTCFLRQKGSLPRGPFVLHERTFLAIL